MKFIYIDPPYNTGNAFEHYDDNLEHTRWLSLMYPRLELLRELLSEDGFICCHIDDAEGPYLKVIMDEIFDRSNFLTTFFIQVRYASKTLKSDMKYHKQVEQVHAYRKSRSSIPNLPRSRNTFSKFIYEVVEKEPGTKLVIGGRDVEVFQKDQYEIIKHEDGTLDRLKEIWASGTILDGNSSGRFFRDHLTGRYAEDGYGVLYKVPNIGDDHLDYRYFTGPKRVGATKGKYFQGVPMNKREKNSSSTSPIENFYDFSGSFGNCRLEGGVDFRSGKKPEILLKTLLEYFSSPDDLVLDSFLGSGTTAAVAHKMGRRYIGVERGEQAVTHCIPRLKNVIKGEQSGVSGDVKWKGGGGFQYYHLGSPIFDDLGNINKDVSFEHLSAHIWFTETKIPLLGIPDSPLIGIHEGVAYYLLYNGILGDKKPDSGNVLTSKVLKSLPPHDGPKVVYGERTMFGDSRLETENITFKLTPYNVKGR